MNEHNGLKKLTGLWVRESKQGKKYFGGKTDEDIFLPAGSKVFIFRSNEQKKSSSSPDYYLVSEVSEPEPEPEPVPDADDDVPF